MISGLKNVLKTCCTTANLWNLKLNPGIWVVMKFGVKFTGNIGNVGSGYVLSGNELNLIKAGHTLSGMPDRYA